MGNVVVVPEAGPGNRIRVIASAYSLAKRYNKRLTINWIREKGLNCRFTELFVKSDDFELLEYDNRLKTLMLVAAQRILEFLKIKKVKNYDVLNNIKTINGNLLKDSDSVFIKTCYKFYKYGNIPLEFSGKITQAGNRFLESRSGGFIGMHIRRGIMNLP
jgi:hypothetical protein